MNRFVWVLVASYVALGTGIVYGVAIGSRTLFDAAGLLLVVLALLQRYLWGGSDVRPRSPEPIPRDRS